MYTTFTSVYCLPSVSLVFLLPILPPPAFATGGLLLLLSIFRTIVHLTPAPASHSPLSSRCIWMPLKSAGIPSLSPWLLWDKLLVSLTPGCLWSSLAWARVHQCIDGCRLHAMQPCAGGHLLVQNSGRRLAVLREHYLCPWAEAPAKAVLTQPRCAASSPPYPVDSFHWREPLVR